MRRKAEWAIDSEAMRTRGIIVKYSVGHRSLRSPRLTLDPEKDALSVCSECTALTPFFLAKSSNLLPFFFLSCIFIFLPNVSYICICQQRRVYHCMNRCVNNNFPSNAIAPWKLSSGKILVTHWTILDTSSSSHPILNPVTMFPAYPSFL